MINLLEAALGYAAQGWPVFPLAPGTKIPPKGSSGFKDATTDPDTIREIWTRTPDANIGFEPGRVGLCAWDVEHDGLQDWADLWEDHLETEPTTRVHSSPRGGRHVFFEGSLPGKVRIKTPSGRKLNIDTRGEGSYVLLPPSQIDGNPYKVVTNAQPAPLPAFLSELARSRTHAVEVPDDVELDRPPNLARAGRHVADCIRRGHVSIQRQGGDATLYQLTCDISDFGISEEQCVELLAGEWSAACVPPWLPGDPQDPGRFYRIIANAYKYQRNRASGANASRATWSGFDPAAFVPQGGGVPEGDVSNPGRGSLGVDDRPRPDRPRFAFLTEAEQDTLPEPRWIVPGLIPERATILIVGKGGTYKTFTAIDIGMAIASGRPTFGTMPLVRGTIVYAALEGHNQIARIRRAAWRKGRDVPDGEVIPFILTGAPTMDNPAARAEFLATADDYVKRTGEKIVMFFIDTLSKAMGGLDEKDPKDVNVLHEFCKTLQDRYDCSVGVIGHTGHGEEAQERARGSSAIDFGADVALANKPNKEAAAFTLKVVKMRDADEGAVFNFITRRVSNSLVVDYLTEAEAKDRANKLDPYTRDKTGAALEKLGASGRDKGVTTHVLAMALTAHLMDDDEETYQDAVAGAEKELAKRSKSLLQAYCATRDRQLIWFMPE